MEKLELELIEAYTNENYHNEALMIKAISQSRFDLLKELSDIAIKHKEDGKNYSIDLCFVYQSTC